MKQVLFHEQALIHKVEQDVVRRSFATYDDARLFIRRWFVIWSRRRLFVDCRLMLLLIRLPHGMP